MATTPTLRQRIRYYWRLATFREGRVFATDPSLERYFTRCCSCGRVFMHYWGCVTAKDRENGRRVGCPCGGMKCRISNLPVWQQAWFVLSRYVVRKLIMKDPYWDPRMPAKRAV